MSTRIFFGIGLVGAVLLGMGRAQQSSNAWPTPERVAELVQKVKPREPMAWTRIPWVASLSEARRFSREEGVPVFLFAHEGNMQLGRA
ncbi:MAG: hypothetical protein K2R98_34050 [Gemmataceae bacterium]|nr:hypothetical protein [Gemmataceae bacterium]